MKTALTIAGSDCSGGAGIQADLKTMIANKVYGMSAITALTAQNTMGVYDIFDVTPEFLRSQLEAVFSDIFPDAIKIGMVSRPELIDVISEVLTKYKATNIVLDPVMVSTSGSKLISDDAISVLTGKLIPLSTVITPNIPEAEVLSGIKINSEEDMMTAGRKISELFGCSVLLKGGHSINDANDLLIEGNDHTWFNGRRIDNPNTHGTGCTLSSAIASNLAKGFDLKTSVSKAKAYISGALEAQLDLGKGRGPMDHGYLIKADLSLEET
ncbi:MAG: bifunctional hydroxymethylpyrimidine kinase/phosphomethylpyrimidine kinase [Clostridiales bacterium]|nr:bifunctional hydroxymethylpyrimidine kinase/phosphomethylpyrimidine kinase [Clostridiales bacterium]